LCLLIVCDDVSDVSDVFDDLCLSDVSDVSDDLCLMCDVSERYAKQKIAKCDPTPPHHHTTTPPHHHHHPRPKKKKKKKKKWSVFSRNDVTESK